MKSNKMKTSPVSWLAEQLALTSDPTFIKVVTEHALEMESKKQQKYDEMLVMLEKIIDIEQGAPTLKEIEQLIKEAKEL